MAAPWSPPVKNQDWEVTIILEDYQNPGFGRSTPILAAGDAKIVKDGGAEANLATLPSVEPAASVYVKVALSATEMNADKIVVHLHDQTVPPEWYDFDIFIQTTA